MPDIVRCPGLICKSVFIERTRRFEKWDNSEDSPRTTVPKLFHYKDKELKQKCNKLKGTTTAENTVISPNSRCGNFTETVTFHKIYTPGNEEKLRYFTQRTYFMKEDYSKETMEIKKGLWYELKRYTQEGKFPVIKYDKVFEGDFQPRR